MGKPTEPQVSVTDTADIKVLSAAAPSWSVQTHDPTQMFPNPRNARRAPVGEQHRPPRCRRTHLAGLTRLDQPSDLDRRSDPLGAGHRHETRPVWGLGGRATAYEVSTLCHFRWPAFLPKGCQFTRFWGKKSDGERFLQTLNGRFLKRILLAEM